MPVEMVSRYTRDMLRARPEVLFLFGDNMERVGMGGQAFACRGEPNAIGLPTKWSPSMYLADADFSSVKSAIDDALDSLRHHLAIGGTVILPADGVGTGLARLPELAPAIHEYISNALKSLSEKGI